MIDRNCHFERSGKFSFFPRVCFNRWRKTFRRKYLIRMQTVRHNHWRFVFTNFISSIKNSLGERIGQTRSISEDFTSYIALTRKSQYVYVAQNFYFDLSLSQVVTSPPVKIKIWNHGHDGEIAILTYYYRLTIYI